MEGRDRRYVKAGRIEATRPRDARQMAGSGHGAAYGEAAGRVNWLSFNGRLANDVAFTPACTGKLCLR
jgi:hypothetical protein